MVTGATTTGRLVALTGIVTVFPIVGLTVAATSLAVLGAAITVAPTWLVLVLTACTGAGLGMVMPAMQVAVQHAAGRESLGAAIGAMSLCRSVGGAIGVAVIGAVIFVSIGRVEGNAGTVLQRVMEAGPSILAQMSQAERGAIAAQLDHTFRIVFFSIAAIAAARPASATTVPMPWC